MKNIFKLIFAGVFVAGIVLGIIFLVNNADLDNQVFNASTSETVIQTNQTAKTDLDALCNITILNDEMQNVKTHFSYAQIALKCLNYRLENLSAISSNVSKAMKKDNDIVIASINQLQDAQKELSRKKRIFDVEYSQYSQSAKVAGYQTIYADAIIVVEKTINLVDNFEKYVSQYVFDDAETIGYKDCLQKIMLELSRQVSLKSLFLTSNSVGYVNELKAVENAYSVLNGNFSYSASSEINSGAVRVESFKQLSKDGILNTFIALDGITTKNQYVQSTNGITKTYLTSIYNLMGGKK